MTARGHGSTVDGLADEIARAIMTGEFAIGAWLRQEVLASRFGVSRQPIREALRQVQAAGLLEVFPNRGALVRGPSPVDIREAYLVRAELEGLAAELASERATPEQIARLRDAEAEFRRAVEAGPERAADAGDHGWGHANDLFHDVVLEAAGVRRLQKTIQDLHRVVPRNLTWSAIRTRRVLTDNVRQHEAIRQAIEAADHEAARSAMRDHILRSGELIADWFERRQRDEAERAGAAASRS